MSQRESGYERKELDRYETPEWVTMALVPHIRERIIGSIYEPAAGSGKMVAALAKAGFMVNADDLSEGRDFLQCPFANMPAIITNPPYSLAREFIDRALKLTRPYGLVAMLLRTDYDHAATRRDLFEQAPFAKKLVLTKRIKWFEDSKGQPSFNHAWFIWDWKHDGPPTLAYGP